MAKVKATTRPKPQKEVTEDQAKQVKGGGSKGGLKGLNQGAQGILGNNSGGSGS